MGKECIYCEEELDDYALYLGLNGCSKCNQEMYEKSIKQSD